MLGAQHRRAGSSTRTAGRRQQRGSTMGFKSLVQRAWETEKSTWQAGGPPRPSELAEVAKFSPALKRAALFPMVKALRAGHLFEGVLLDTEAGTLTRGSASRKDAPQTVPLAGARASVETAGQVRTRGGAGLMIGGIGVLATGKTDERELYLTIEHTHGVWVVPCDPAQGLKAREFAALVNTAARGEV